MPSVPSKGLIGKLQSLRRVVSSSSGHVDGGDNTRIGLQLYDRILCKVNSWGRGGGVVEGAAVQWCNECNDMTVGRTGTCTALLGTGYLHQHCALN